MAYNPQTFSFPRGLNTALPNPAIPFVTPEMYGAKGDGSTDDAGAINSALVAAATVGTPVLLLSETYKVNSTLSWDQSKTTLMAYGATLDFSNIGTGTALAPFTTWPDPNSMAGVHNLRPMRGFRILGPSDSGICLAPVASTIGSLPWFTGMVTEQIAVTGFQLFYDIPGGAVLPVFRDVVFGSVSGRESGWFVRSEGAVNAENLLFDRCFVVNVDGIYIETATNINLDMTFRNCSLDGLTYLATGGTITSPGTAGIIADVSFEGGHWEPDRFSDYLIWVANAGRVYANNIQFVGAPGTLHVPFKSDANELNGGLILRDFNINTTFWSGGVICDGTGNFKFSSSAVENTFSLNVSAASNRVPSYTWPNSTSLTSNWSGSPTYDTSVKPSGAVGSANISGGTASKFTTPCSPGQTLQAQAQIQFTGLGSGDEVVFTLQYLDGGGNELFGVSYLITTALASFTLQQSAVSMVGPAGTVTAAVTFRYIASGGGATVHFGLPQVIVT